MPYIGVAFLLTDKSSDKKANGKDVVGERRPKPYSAQLSFAAVIVLLAFRCYHVSGPDSLFQHP